MSDDLKQKAREQAKDIRARLDAMKLAHINEAHAMTIDKEDRHLDSMKRRREAIEALEYALTLVPAGPARVGRVVI